MWKPILAGLGAAALLSGAAHAQITATAVTDLNIRGGPGIEFPVVGVIAANASVALGGCVEGTKWCSVDAGGVEGWAYSDYLVTGPANTIIVTERTPELEVPVVTYDGPSAAVPGAVGGAVIGALIGGPVGAAVGAAAGATVGSVIVPPDQVVSYVTANPVEPVFLEGEVVVGAQLPPEVTVASIPDYEYAYVYVNGVPVLVEPATREIVYVVR